MKNPRKQIEAAARTAIYTALFGRSNFTFEGRGKRPNLPELDSTRQLPYHWEWHTANHTFIMNIDTANFPTARIAELEKRLHQLKSYKPEDAARSAEITRRVNAGDFR